VHGVRAYNYALQGPHDADEIFKVMGSKVKVMDTTFLKMHFSAEAHWSMVCHQRPCGYVCFPRLLCVSMSVPYHVTALKDSCLKWNAIVCGNAAIKWDIKLFAQSLNRILQLLLHWVLSKLTRSDW